MPFIRSLVFSIGMIVSTVFFAITSLVLIVIPHRWRYQYTILWNRFNIWWLRVTCNIRHDIQGIENIPTGPAIIFAKHQSTWETMMLPLIFPPQVWILKRELLWVPFFGWGLALMKPIAIDRKAGRRAVTQIIEQGRERLQQGLWIVFFPEGTRVAPGAKVRYKMGGALLAEAVRYPIVPVTHNAGEHWRRKGFIKYPGTIKMRIGPAIDTSELDAAQINQITQEWIETNLAELSSDA